MAHNQSSETEFLSRAAVLRGICTLAGVLLGSAIALSGQAISKVVATGLTDSSAVITWTTDFASSSQVNYGVTPNYGFSSNINQTPVTAHSVTLSGLTPNTLYNFDVVSSGSSGNPSTSANFRFATISSTPIISDLNVIYITSNSATINWTTDQPSTAVVNYGTATNYGSSSPFFSTPSTVHTVTLNGLGPNTTYNFSAVSAAGSGVPSASANLTFTTANASASVPNISNLAANGVTTTSATITWSTDVSANTVVAYGFTTALGTFSPVQTALSTSHGVTLVGLDPGTNYYFICQSTDANGATGYSYISHFTTADPPPVAPIISNVKSSTPSPTSATITWTTDVPSNSSVNYGTNGSFGLSALDSTMTRSHSITLTGLSPGMHYNFQAVSADAAGVATFGVNLTGVTVWAWGDSQTVGGKDGNAINYPNTLANALGVPIVNGGVGGDTSAQIAKRMLATPAASGPGNCNIFWAGSNNPTQVSQIIADDASMVNALSTPQCYLILGDVNWVSTPKGTSTYNDIVTTNGKLAATYPNNYLDIRELVVQDFDPSLPLDVADHANEVMPASLRAVVASGSITSGALDSSSCNFSVSAGTQGPGTVIIIDSETIMINAVSGNQITACSRGYNLIAAASHAANAAYSEIDPIHLGYKGLQFVASKVAAWFQSYPWPNCGGSGSCPFLSNFTTSGTSGPGPVISNIATTNVSQNAVTVTWTTDQPATSLVRYGTTTDYGSSSEQNGTLVTAHTVTLTGLTAGTFYDFDVISANAAAQSTTSPNIAVTTTAAANAAAPFVGYVAAWGINDSGATVTWSTDVPANTQLAYGTTNALGQFSPIQTAMNANHGVTLTGLASGTTYTFVAQSTAASGATGYSAAMTFTTTGTAPAGIPPASSNVAVTDTSSTTTSVTWTKVAIEGETVFLPAGTTYRFGIDTRYLAPVTTTTDQTIYVYYTSFGGDPAPGVVKELDVQDAGGAKSAKGASPQSPPSQLVAWTKVADEGETVFLPAGTTYRFGIDTRYLPPATTTADQKLYVYYTTFGGDPAYGVVKELDVEGNGAGVLVNNTPLVPSS